MSRYVFDIETLRTSDEVGGWGNKHKMGIAVLCLKDLDSGEEFVISDSYPDAIPLNKLFNFVDGNTLIGHNIMAFDWKLILEYFYRNGFDIKVKTNLIDTKVGRMSLERITRALFNTKKIMDGALAPIEWRTGLSNKSKVVEYCKDDVFKTYNVFNYGLENGFIRYFNGDEIRTVNVMWGRALENEPKIQYPKCFGGYMKLKKPYQCRKCAFRNMCNDYK